MTYESWVEEINDNRMTWFRQKHGRWPKNNEHMPSEDQLRAWYAQNRTSLWVIYLLNHPKEVEELQLKEAAALNQFRRDFPGESIPGVYNP